MKHFLQFFNKHRIYIAALFFIHASFFMYAIFYAAIYTLDSDEYIQTAVNIKNHFTIYNHVWSEIKIPEFYSLRPPLYGFFILGARSIYNSDFTVLLFQNLISIFVWIYVVNLLEEWEGISKLKWVIILSLLLFPTQLILVNSIMADALLQLLLLLAFAMLFYYRKTNKNTYLIYYNLILVAAVFTKPVLFYFWIPNLFLGLYLSIQTKNITAIAATVLMPIAIFLWCLRNEGKTGYFHFSSIKTQNILDLNAGDVMKITIGEKASDSTKNEILRKAEKMTYKIKSEYINDAAIQIIKSNIPVYIYAHVKGMLNFMLATGRVDMVTFFPHKPEKPMSILRELEINGFAGFIYYCKNVNLGLIGYMFLILVWNTLLFICTILFYFISPKDSVLKVFIVLVIAYTCFVCGTAGYARFKMCILPLMLMTIPQVLQYFQNRIVKKN